MTTRMVVLAGLMAGGLLAALVWQIPLGAEKLVLRRTTAAPAAALRDCLAGKLWLGAWHGADAARYASRIGLRVVVTDNGKQRQVGLFTAGGAAVGKGTADALGECASLH